MVEALEWAAVLALVGNASAPWHEVAALIEEAGGALPIIRDDLASLHPDGTSAARALGQRVDAGQLNHYLGQIQAWESAGIRLHTISEESYPANLREVYNRPPFLFVRGVLADEDSRAVAVVGTRQPSEAGLGKAHQLAADLAELKVTVVSGLARGIDTAAHEGALKAGGRTLAVLGTGINRIYPPDNETLAARIVRQGALLSQFWPDAPPTRATFPIRNVVTSGLALGTVVVEAHGRSGASMQARICLDHGKRLFLLRSLVLQEEWAQGYARRPGVVVVDSVDDVATIVDELLNPPVQLQIC